MSFCYCFILIGQVPTISPTPVIEGQVGDSVRIDCMSPRPNEAINIILEKYCPEQDVFVVFETSVRLIRINFLSLVMYEFGPLMPSDSGIILACYFPAVRSANSTISVICKLLMVTIVAVLINVPSKIFNNNTYECWMVLKVGQTEFAVYRHYPHGFSDLFSNFRYHAVKYMALWSRPLERSNWRVGPRRSRVRV